MGVVYIGDRAVGKTHLAVELANPRGNYVKVSVNNFNPELSYEYLKSNLVEDDGTAKGKAKQTEIGRIDNDKRPLNIEVRLPTGASQIAVDWIDSPGEIFRKAWQSENPVDWQSFLETVRRSEGIFLIMPPYREILKPDVSAEEHKIPTLQQWCNRFERWAEFFCHDCPKVRHIAICLNKADLLYSDMNQEAERLIYEPYGSRMNWPQRHNHVVTGYFGPIKSQLDKIDRSRSGLAVRCFITSIYNRTLLELPWIYMGCFLAN